MVITPIVSAFDHCSGMTMPDHLNLITNSVSIDPLLASKHQKHSKETHQENSIQHCQSSGSGNCNFNFCGNGNGILSSLSNSNLITSYLFSSFEPSSFYKTPLSPEIRPPISVL